MLVEAIYIYIYIISKILKTKFKISFPDSHTQENNSREKGKRKKNPPYKRKSFVGDD